MYLLPSAPLTLTFDRCCSGNLHDFVCFSNWVDFVMCECFNVRLRERMAIRSFFPWRGPPKNKGVWDVPGSLG